MIPLTMRTLAVAMLLAAAPQSVSAQFELTYPDPIQLPQPDASDFLAGYVDHPGATVVVEPDRGRRRWDLRMRAQDSDLGHGKPLSHVLWRVGTSGAWTPLTNAFVTIANGRGTQTVVVYFRVLLYWDLDDPATYAVDVTFSAEY